MFLIIQTRNSSYIISDGGSDYATLALAKTAAVEGALQIASDEIRDGGSASSVEVVLKDLDGRQHHRMSVAVCVASMFIPEHMKG